MVSPLRRKEKGSGRGRDLAGQSCSRLTQGQGRAFEALDSWHCFRWVIRIGGQHGGTWGSTVARGALFVQAATVRTPAALCRLVNPVRRLDPTWPNYARPLWPCATGESGSLAEEPFATGRTSRPGGGFTFALAELADNRPLQLDKPTGGERE
jgi:hypothetical protein